MKVVVIIVTYNNESSIENCIFSLEKQKVSQIIVVDNSSLDRTTEIITKKFKKIRLILSTKNLGYARGNNIGIKEALIYVTDYILIINPDTVIESSCVNNLLITAEKYQGYGVFGPTILQEDKKHIWSIGGELDKRRYTAGLVGFQGLDSENYKEHERDFISGTCMLIPRKLLDKGLRFYEPYFLYYEDVEFCVRARKLGFPSYAVPRAKIVHTEVSKNFSLKDYYLARNHLLFIERNAPFLVKLREMIRLLKTLYEHKNARVWNSVKGISDYFLRHFYIYRK